MANKILIGGGTGFVGGALMQRLARAGYQPITITRESKQLTRNQTSWDQIKSQGLPRGCHAIVNLSGATIGDPWKRWTKAYKEQVYSSRIDTTKLLATVIKDSEPNLRPKVFITTSAVGYYTPSTTEEYTEDSPGGDPSKFFSKLCRDWESAANLGDNCSDVRQAIVRIGIVLGRPGGIIQNTIFQYKLGFGGHMGDGTQWFPWVHIDDVTGIMQHIIETESCKGIYNAVSPHSVTSAEFSRSYASACMRNAIMHMPKNMVNFIFGKERGELLLTGQKVKPKRVLLSRYEFDYPELPEAVAECARLELNNEEMERETSKFNA